MERRSLRNNGNQPIPRRLADHIEVFIEELPLDPLPEINLLDPIEAQKARDHAIKLLDVLSGKIKQAQALKTALLTTTTDPEDNSSN